MITSLRGREDRISSIKAGAADFISKPINAEEVLARVKMLLQSKGLCDRLSSAYHNIAKLTTFGEQLLTDFDPAHFDFMKNIDMIVDQIIRNGTNLADSPHVVLVGLMDLAGICQWYRYDSSGVINRRSCIHMPLERNLTFTDSGDRKVVFYNEFDADSSESLLVGELSRHLVPVSNLVRCSSDSFCVMALNYGRDVSIYDAGVLNSVVMQSLFLKSLAMQVKDTESAFDYMVYALARASEANDEDTGAHILRVGDYCAVLARQFGMSDLFVDIIRIQASLHDVGKIHVSPAILKKSGPLDEEEWGEMKKHPIQGQKIIGGHNRMTVAAQIAIAHHERWDGSGYPYGLKGEQIPIAARIMTVSDQYDALRNARCYKQSFAHREAVDIITHGDGRTMRCHFDPRVLKAFEAVASQLDEIYMASQTT